MEKYMVVVETVEKVEMIWMLVILAKMGLLRKVLTSIQLSMLQVVD